MATEVESLADLYDSIHLTDPAWIGLDAIPALSEGRPGWDTLASAAEHDDEREEGDDAAEFAYRATVGIGISTLMPLPPPRGGIGIVGGGPAGLMTAYLLQKRLPGVKVTILEATDRLGGKMLTQTFPDGTPYEAGVAELYEYRGKGSDPLRELIERDLGLRTVDMSGGAVVLDGEIFRDLDEFGQRYGAEAQGQVERFHEHMAELMPLEKFANSWQSDNDHPWATRTFHDCLKETVPNADARRYILTAIHSDLATEAHLCTGLNGVKNALLDSSEYIQLYHVVGGIEQIARTLAQRLEAGGVDVRLGCRVKSVYKAGKTYKVECQCCETGECETAEFDAVVAAVPLQWLKEICWCDEEPAQLSVEPAQGLQKNGEFHGPKPPGPSWVLARTGPRGGKVWAPKDKQAVGEEPAPKTVKTGESTITVEPGRKSGEESVAKAQKEYKKLGTKAPAFKNWFGEWESDPANASKVVNKEGEPQETHRIPRVVYHGSSRRFDAFEQGESPGIVGFFTESPEYAKAYGDEVQPFFLNIRKPLDLSEERATDVKFSQSARSAKRTVDEWFGIMQKQGVDTSKIRLGEYVEGNDKTPYWGLLDSSAGIAEKDSNLIDELRRQGFDGIIGREEGSPAYVTFEPTQIKSVDNRGTFDSKDTNINLGIEDYADLQTVAAPPLSLSEAMAEHCQHYDFPGHYLRATLLFREPFWKSQRLPGCFWMQDSFSGVCVYDESTRWNVGPGHVLSWLISGNAALALVSLNQTPDVIVQQCLHSLPPVMLEDAKRCFVEGRVARWVGSLSGNPGGSPAGTTQLSVDAQHHQHKDKGPGGGQFTATGSGGGGGDRRSEPAEAGTDASAKHKIAGDPTEEHRAAARRWADAAPDLTPQTRAVYAEHMSHALSVLPAGIAREAAEPLQYGGVKFHPDIKALQAEAKRIKGNVASDVVGFAHDRGRGTDLHLDGDDDPRGTYVHELWHAADNGGFHSDDKGWKAAFKRDILNGKVLLSRYAVAKANKEHAASEGFAEFGRVLAERGLPYMTASFPNAVKHLKAKGLL